MNDLTRAFEAAVTDVNETERTVVAVVSTAALDRYRTVIDPSGVDLTNYRKNPTLLYEHGEDPTRGRLPIGRALWIKQQDNKLILRAKFHTDDYSHALFEMYRDELLRAWSIFAVPDPNRCGPPTHEEIRRRPELIDCEFVYRACDLCEVSAVSVGGNAECLSLLVERGIWVPETVDRGTTTVGGGKIKPTGQSAPDSDDEKPAENDQEAEEAVQDDETEDPEQDSAENRDDRDSRDDREPDADAEDADSKPKSKKSAPAERTLPPLVGVSFADALSELTRDLKRHRRDQLDQLELLEAVRDLRQGRV